MIGAHRGASARAPENTLAAFSAALEDGAEMVELDVHLSADGFLPVLHDAHTDRTTGLPGIVRDATMADLRRRDAGRFKGQEWAGEGIPELGDVFELARGRLLVNVEVKGGLAVIPLLAQRVTEHAMEAQVVVSSFDPPVARAVAALPRFLLTGLLLEEPGPDPVAAAAEVGAMLLHVEHTYLTADLVDAIHRSGRGVVAWTVNAPDEMRRLAALGVDAILSDDPRLLHMVVGDGAADGEATQ
jgi:glycerophosphoryl diester phosphodiesterase